MSKAKISDVRQGVTLYHVSAFPHKEMPSSIEAIFITKPAARTKNGLFSEAKYFYDDELSCGSYTSMWSLRDAGIIPNTYNFHKTFTSLKAAKRYAERMDRVCLTAAERVKYGKKVDGFMWNN